MKMAFLGTVIGLLMALTVYGQSDPPDGDSDSNPLAPTSSDTDISSETADTETESPETHNGHATASLAALKQKFEKPNKSSASEFPAPTTMHPAVEPLNASRQNAFFTNTEIDPEATCGNCHDTGFIVAHNTHRFKTRPRWATQDVTITCFDCHVSDLSGWKKENTDTFGRLSAAHSLIRRATSKVCAECHGIADFGALSIPEDFETNVRDESGYLTYDLTRRTGVFFSDMPYSGSQLNLRNKTKMNFPADVHAARLVGCTDCHHASNNPTRTTVKKHQQSHLKTDPRRVSFSDYLERPNHELWMPKCTECHDAAATHDFLPYKTRHLSVLDCQSCHVPKVYGPVLSAIDETVLDARGNPVLAYAERSESGEALNAQLRAGISPALLAYRDETKKRRIGAFNFVVNWYWMDDATGRRVELTQLKKAFLLKDSGGHKKAVIDLFDSNRNKKIDTAELIIQTAAQQKTVASWLRAAGAKKPRLIGVVSAHSISHGITNKDGVMASCDSCHDSEGRLANDIMISNRTPAGGTIVEGENISQLTHGKLVVSSTAVNWQRENTDDTWYVFGFSRVDWSDTTGFLLFVFSFIGIAAHGGYRFVTRKQRRHNATPMKKVYMYTLYERIWHWLMAASVIVLLATGLSIHFPLEMPFIPFPIAVTVHNITAIVLVINAALSLFFHIASAAIVQFIPERDGLLQSLIKQVSYYTRGIFLGHPHPTDKTPDKKLNPLQQLTYLGLLNVLFPLQVVTGIAIWLNAGWPQLLESVGGLTIVGPLHNLGSWLFLAFLVVHLYLTTTGHTLVSNITAMVSGYDEIEVSADSPVISPAINEGSND